MGLTAKYYFLIPEKVVNVLPELRELAVSEIPSFNESYLLELLTLVSLNIHKNKGEARLKASYLKKLIPSYEKYVSFLLDLKVINRSDQYIPGKISYRYFFTTEYRSRYTYSPVKDQYLIRRIEKNQLRRNCSRKYPNQNIFIRQLTIDMAAFEYINNIPDIEKHNAALSAALKIYHREIFYSVDTTSGRFHSNLTNLLSILRQFIRIQGKPLANIDIKNSQPYLLTLLLTNPRKAEFLTKSKKFSMLLHSLQPIKTLDVTLWLYLTKTGKLYNFLYDLFRKNGLMKKYSLFDDSVKDRIKKKLFGILYGRTQLWWREHEILYDNFPNVYERICRLKGTIKGDRFINHKRLAILLQSLEAYLILDIILPRINKEHPEIIAVTIHDSVMTSIMTNDIDIVQNIMNEELTKFVGQPPTLKVEKFDFFSKKTDNNMNTREDNKKKQQVQGVMYHYDSENLVTK